jgi:hypothetical protein
MGDQSFYLFAVPTFLSGAASVMDPADSLSTYNESPTGMDADAIATYADWKAVAGDLTVAINQTIRLEEKGDKAKETGAIK